jgi:signal transduction histidine kinase
MTLGYLKRFGAERLRKVFWTFALLAVFINLMDDANIYFRNIGTNQDNELIDQSFREHQRFERLVEILFNENSVTPVAQAEAMKVVDELKTNAAANPEALTALDGLIKTLSKPPPLEWKNRTRADRLAVQKMRVEIDKTMRGRIDRDKQRDSETQTIVLGANIVDLILIFILIGVYFLERGLKDEIESALNGSLDDLRDSNQKLQVLTLAHARKLKVAAHDIKSPLSALKGYAAIARESTASDQPIARLLQRMDNLTNSTLDMVNSLFSESADVIPWGPVRIEDLLAEVCSASFSLAKQKDQRIDFSGAGFSSLVQGNGMELMSCFYNLLSNVRLPPIFSRRLLESFRVS